MLRSDNFRPGTITLKPNTNDSAPAFRDPSDALISARKNLQLARVYRNMGDQTRAALFATYASADRCVAAQLRKPPVIEYAPHATDVPAPPVKSDLVSMASIVAQVSQEFIADDNGSDVETDDDETECEGHESLDGAHMGESVYCDGSCK